MDLGEPKPALERGQQALALFVELADEPGQAAAWNGIGLARTALGDAAGSVAALRSAVALERGLGRLYEEAQALNNLGFALHTQGELREAQASYEQALERFHQVGETGWWETSVLQNLAALYTALAEPEAALRYHLQVIERRRALGDRRGEAQSLNNLGVLYSNLGDLGKALDAYASALTIFRQIGDRLWEAALLHNRGVAYHDLGDYPRALADLEQALAIRRQTGDRRGEIGTGSPWETCFPGSGRPRARSTPAGRPPLRRARLTTGEARCSRAASWAKRASRPARRKQPSQSWIEPSNWPVAWTTVSINP